MKAIPSQSYKEGVETMNLKKNEIKSAVIAMVMGDGCLSRSNGRKGYKVGNAFFQMTHCAAQYEYMLWKKGILDKVSKCKIHKNDGNGFGGKNSKAYHLYSGAHPTYSALYSRFYKYPGRKGVDEYLVKMITPLGLAILYMDDGCIGKAIPKYWTKETFYLCLDGFDYANLFLIKKSLKIKFDLDWNINKTSVNYHQLRLLNNHNQKFVDIIKPYILQIPCMTYKLGSYVNPSELKDDIVRSSQRCEEVDRNDQPHLTSE